MRVDVYFHLQSGEDQAVLKSMLATLTRKVDTMSGSIQDKLDALAQEVADETAVKDAVLTFMQGLPAMIQSAVDAATAKGATPEQLAAFDELTAKLDENSKAIAEAVSANTPSA